MEQETGWRYKESDRKYYPPRSHCRPSTYHGDRNTRACCRDVPDHEKTREKLQAEQKAVLGGQ